MVVDAATKRKRRERHTARGDAPVIRPAVAGMMPPIKVKTIGDSQAHCSAMIYVSAVRAQERVGSESCGSSMGTGEPGPGETGDRARLTFFRSFLNRMHATMPAAKCTTPKAIKSHVQMVRHIAGEGGGQRE